MTNDQVRSPAFRRFGCVPDRLKPELQTAKLVIGHWSLVIGHYQRGHYQRRAFTLIELILVMALLVIVMAVSAPALSNFFRGRTLDSEARARAS